MFELYSFLQKEIQNQVGNELLSRNNVYILFSPFFSGKSKSRRRICCDFTSLQVIKVSQSRLMNDRRPGLKLT